MVFREPIIGESSVKYNGVFDMPLLYKKLHGWILREGFKLPKEVKYVERIKPFGKIIDFTWKTSKEELDGYVVMELEVKFLLIGLTEVELDRPSGKIKLNKADASFSFSATLVRNPGNKAWSDGSVMAKVYDRYIIADQLDKFRIDLYKKTEKLVDETKTFLALYRF